MTDSDKAHTEDKGTAKRVMEQLAVFRDSPAYSDVIVLVGSSEFRCHRVILAAASKFFHAAFSSEMREANEGKISLNNISAELFSQFLSCIYSGKYILSKENLFDVWAAADFLEISILLTQCEEFFKETITCKNCFRYYQAVKPLRETAKQLALEFILNHFEQIVWSPHHLKDLELDELKELLSNEKLSVFSEDTVVATILRWAELTPTAVSPISSVPKEKLASLRCECEGPNAPKRLRSSDKPDETICICCTQRDKTDDEQSERAKHLSDLLECTRYLLVSRNCVVQTLACHPLVTSNERCESLVTEIRRYQAMSYLHPTWCPSAAILRNSSNMVNVLLTYKTRRLYKLAVMRPGDACWKEISLPRLTKLSKIWSRPFTGNLFSNDDKIYLCTADGRDSVYSCEGKNWMDISITGLKSPFCVIGDALYTYVKDSKNRQVVRKFPNFHQSCTLSSAPAVLQTPYESDFEKMEVKDVTSMGDNLVFFRGMEDLDGYMTVTIDLFRSTTFEQPMRLKPASRFVTFRKDNEAFVLQENGTLWRLKKPHKFPKIVKELKLWEKDTPLDGAVLFGDQLFAVGQFCGQPGVSEKLNVSLGGVFNSVIKIQRCPDNGNDYAGVILAKISRSLLV